MGMAQAKRARLSSHGGRATPTPGAARARITLALALAMLPVVPVQGFGQGKTYAVVVSGLGGAPEYRSAFHEQAMALRRAFLDKHGMDADHVINLGENVDADPEAITARSTTENVLNTLAGIAARAEPLDRLLIVLIGHGTVADGEARLNLPGPDLSPSSLGSSLAAFPTQTVAVVHVGSASGGFLRPLSGKNRIVVAATRNERERNATEFGSFFVEAVAGDGADLDKDERTSLLEAFQFARMEVARRYEEANEILTEHAVLDDNGDGEGSAEPGVAAADGRLAATFQLGGVSGTAAQIPDDPALARLYEERREIQDRIEALRSARDSMEEEAYLDRMEDLLVELALKNREIRAVEGGGGGGEAEAAGVDYPGTRREPRVSDSQMASRPDLVRHELPGPVENYARWARQWSSGR